MKQIFDSKKRHFEDLEYFPTIFESELIGMHFQMLVKEGMQNDSLQEMMSADNPNLKIK